ncbi:hypothetical protein FALCPG4_008853 [Fusarium falciforme]
MACSSLLSEQSPAGRNADNNNQVLVGYAFINFEGALRGSLHRETPWVWPLQACKILGFLPKKALWSTCGHLGWSKAGLWPLQACKILGLLPREGPLVDWGGPLPGPMASRASRDQYLIDRRADGYTYREIKQAGGYAEAEPTLRGRWRTLTKEPEQRLRKPKWEQHDLEMLRVESLCFFVAWDLNPLQACKCWVARPAPESLVHERPCSSALASLQRIGVPRSEGQQMTSTLLAFKDHTQQVAHTHTLPLALALSTDHTYSADHTRPTDCPQRPQTHNTDHMHKDTPHTPWERAGWMGQDYRLHTHTLK